MTAMLNPRYSVKFYIGLLTLFGIALVAMGCKDRRDENRVQHFRKAEDLFRRRCSSAGETIKRTVPDVEGIFLLKVRPKESGFGDQFRMNDPYGSDLDGDAYIESFLSAKYEERRIFAGKFCGNALPDLNTPVGYRFVQAVDPEDGQLYQFTAHLEQPGKTDPAYVRDYWKVVLEKSAVVQKRARYGVTYDDISTPEDRSLWVAGSSPKVIDLDTNEVIAERVGYMFDPGQGSGGAGGGREPWVVATNRACPAFPDCADQFDSLDKRTGLSKRS